MPVFRTPAFVLRAYDYSESDRILVLFTREQGKLRAIAKGVRRSGSRLGGALGLLSLSELQIFGNEQRELFRITQAQSLAAYVKIKGRLEALGRAARMAELISELAPDRQPLPEIFSLTAEGLALLEHGAPPDTVGVWFDLNLLDRLGYRPDLEGCQVCRRDAAEFAYHPETGGLVCRACRPGGGVSLSRGGRNLLRKFQTEPAERVRRNQVSPGMQVEVAAVLDAAIHHQTGRSLKTDVFRNAVARLS